MQEGNINMKKVITIFLVVFIILVSTSCVVKKEEHSYDNDILVYVSRYGKIHAYPNCSNMVYYTTMPLDDALEKGYDICKKCADDIGRAIEDYDRYN